MWSDQCETLRSPAKEDQEHGDAQNEHAREDHGLDHLHHGGERIGKLHGGRSLGDDGHARDRMIVQFRHGGDGSRHRSGNDADRKEYRYDNSENHVRGIYARAARESKAG